MNFTVPDLISAGFWQRSFVHTLKVKYGYATGMFGKVLNDMSDYGCDQKSATPGR